MNYYLFNVVCITYVQVFLQWFLVQVFTATLLLLMKAIAITLTLSWGEPFNNHDPIVNYIVSCSGDVTCPPNFTTIDDTTRSYTITNLTPMTNYTFSVEASYYVTLLIVERLV